MKRRNLLGPVLRWTVPGLCLLSFGCGPGVEKPSPSSVPADALMVVGDRVLSMQEAEAMARQRGPELSRELLLRERQRHLQWVALARQTGFDRRPDVVEAMEQLLAERMARSESGTEAELTEEALRQHYDAHPDQYTNPPRRRLAVVRIQVPSHADLPRRERYQQRAREALEALIQAPAQTVGDCVARYSDDNATRFRGGDAGWMTPDPQSVPWPPALHQAAWQLRHPGDCTRLIEVPDGFLMGRLMQSVPASRRSFAEVREEVRWAVKREAEIRREASLQQRLDAAVPVRFHDSNRVRFLVPARPSIPPPPDPLPSR